MTCTYCGAADHSLTRCPWKDTAMRSLAILLATLALTGCAGLKTAWRLQLEMQYVTPEEAPAKPEVPALPSGQTV